MSVDDEQRQDNAEMEHMITNQQRPESVMCASTSRDVSHVHTRRLRMFCVVLLLLFIAGGSIVALANYQARHSNVVTNMKKQNDMEDSSDENGEAEQANNDDQHFQLRSYTEHHKPKSPERVGHVNIYINKDGYRRNNRRDNQRLRFPVLQYDRRHMPFNGPFLSFMPRIPIFVDRYTKQTLIFSPTGGVYIIPPLINFYGKMYSVAELIASGYASLVSSGVPPIAPINMIPFFLPQPLIGRDIPAINHLTGGFKGGLRTSLGSFSISKPYKTVNNIEEINETEEDDDDDNRYRYEPVLNNNYKRSSKAPNTKKPTNEGKTKKCQPSTPKHHIPHWLTTSSELSDPNESITFFLVLKQDPIALQKLEKIFWKITDPNNDEYQNWLTRPAIDKILTLDNRILNAVKHWFTEHSFTSVKLIGTDVFQIKTTVQHLSNIFSIKFYRYKHSKTGKTFHRAHERFCFPGEIGQYIDFWLGINDFLISHRNSVDPNRMHFNVKDDQDPTNVATVVKSILVPQFILTYYNIPNVRKTDLDSQVSQGALEFLGQFYSENDLKLYSQLVNIPFKPLKPNHILGINNQSDPGIETMLDIELMFGINPLADTWYLNYNTMNMSGENFYTTIFTLNQVDDVPQVLSISYGDPESLVCTQVTDCAEEVLDADRRYITRTNIEFMKLTMRGISIFVSSGDDGVNSFLSNCTNKVFYPDYPASSPFITSVGGTTLVNAKYETFADQPPACTELSSTFKCVSDGDEIAVSVDDPTFTRFPSGGGFSDFAPQPSYQKQAVDHYFRDERYYTDKTSDFYPPSSMYKRYGRAFPDVSAFGVRIFMVQDSVNLAVGGTSASSPLWASIVSILNSHSIKITGKTLGFLNPLLYQMAKECPNCLKDITVGNNKCTSTVCTSQCKGFQAACGWDPVTGLGSPNVGNILKYITKLLEKKMKKNKNK
ncbi:unnamed protein product [Adineta ricciae]|uniref:Peptidase S53 domain-containing protein n=1 Tax=Adineta ricciae TaxID=249248 RepID=A0A815FLU9_ADIRI|nr:unnamed protein product [Adineta ricciae]